MNSHGPIRAGSAGQLRQGEGRSRVPDGVRRCGRESVSSSLSFFNAIVGNSENLGKACGILKRQRRRAFPSISTLHKSSFHERFRGSPVDKRIITYLVLCHHCYIRHLAPETLEYGLSTVCSDVYTYGISIVGDFPCSTGGHPARDSLRR